MSQEIENKPRVGIGVMIFRDGKVLLGKRKGKFGDGQWAFPGGHLEYMESFENCAKRETMEEAGIKIQNVRFHYLGNIKIYAPRHYVQIGMLADWKSGEAENKEPEKLSECAWFPLDNLPKPLFFGSKIMVDAYIKGIHYKDLEN